jgi:uncharacterized protein (DUF934 family)
MQRIIKNNEVVDETWHLLPKDFSIDEITNCDDYIVPLALWREHSRMLKARDGGLGVWLDADEEAEEIGDDVANFKVIALNFPAFTDGRNYSNARLLRDRYGFKANCGRLAMCCATSCSICIVAVSMPLHCVPTKTRMKRWKASKTSR